MIIVSACMYNTQQAANEKLKNQNSNVHISNPSLMQERLAIARPVHLEA